MKKGFTLLEVLLALGMLALVVSLIQGTYSGVARSRKFSQQSSRQTHAAAFVLHRLGNELSMVYADPKRKEATGLVLQSGTNGFAELAFTSRVPPVAGFSSGGDAELAYFPATDRDTGTVLMRREADDLDGDLQTGGEEYPLLEGISQFTVECYDGEQWVEDWDTSERVDPPLLPLAVRVTLGWQAEGEEAANLYRTATPIYAAVDQP